MEPTHNPTDNPTDNLSDELSDNVTHDLTHHLTLVPADPPRASWFGCWDPANPGGLLGGPRGGADRVELRLMLPAKRRPTITVVSAQRLALADAIDLLAHLPRSAEASRSVHAWAGIIRTALSFIADGRVLPWISPDGFDSWRVDPLGPRQLEQVQACVRSLPAEAHASPGPGRDLVADPEFIVRSLFDAVADTFLRTAAAHRVGSLTLFADRRPTKVQHLRPWVNELATVHCASSRLVLRAHPPERHQAPEGEQPPEGDDDRYWKLRFQLQSRVDPSLIIDAADFWKTPAMVMERLGQQAEITLLAGLRRTSQLVPALAHILDQNTPVEATLHEDNIDALIDRLDELADAEVEVRWPSELISPKIERKLVVSTEHAPSGALAGLLSLENLLSVDWEFLIDGVALTSEELTILGDAKRAVVPLRGKWVQLDRRARERLKARPPALSTGELLLAAMEGTLDLDALADHDATMAGDSEVEVRLEGAVAELSEHLAALTQEREQEAPATLEADLRPYQKRGLAWMVDLCQLGLGGCLADDMGLGKTVQLLALHAVRSGPTLVVCPTSLLNNWAREAAKFLPGVTVKIFHGQNRHAILDQGVEPGDLVLTTYGVVRSDVESLAALPWDLVVADEAQFIKNPRSRAAKAIRQIPASARIALTGTPVENRLSELWAILDWTVPGILGSLATFKRDTATPIERDDDREVALRLNRLVRPFLLRRRKTDPGIAPELPPKIERDVIVPLTAEQVTLYKATVEHSLVEVAEAEGIARRGLVLKLLTGLKQIANHPAQFLGEKGPLIDRSGKLEALTQLLDTTRESGESTLVFTQYVKMGTLLVEHLRSAGHTTEMLYGAMSVTARQELVDRFQAGGLEVLVLSLKAGGTGLNLTTATNVVHYDRWWNPAVEDQATDRAHRIGQNRTVTVHRIITEGTVEDRVADLLRSKRKLADRVVGSGDGWIGELSDADLAELVTLETVS